MPDRMKEKVAELLRVYYDKIGRECGDVAWNKAESSIAAGRIASN